MKSTTKVTIIVLVAAALLIAGMAYVSNELFQTPNFISAFYGYATVRFTDTEYVEIAHSPRLVITSGWDKSSLDKFMIEFGGYTEVPDSQMGLLYTYENDNYRVSVHSNWEHSLDYVVWEINEPKPKQD